MLGKAVASPFANNTNKSCKNVFLIKSKIENIQFYRQAFTVSIVFECKKSTITHKFNDYRNKRKMPLRISYRSGTFFT